MGTAVKHPVPDLVKPSFVIFDTWRSWLGVRVPGCQKLRRLNQVWHGMLYSCTHIATVDVKGLNTADSSYSEQTNEKQTAELKSSVFHYGGLYVRLFSAIQTYPETICSVSADWWNVPSESTVIGDVYEQFVSLLSISSCPRIFYLSVTLFRHPQAWIHWMSNKIHEAIYTRKLCYSKDDRAMRAS